MTWILKIFESSFLKFFSILYPIVSNHFTTYTFLLLFILLIIIGNYHLIKSVHAKCANLSSLLFEVVLIGIEIYLILFIAWFLFIHFKTYTLL